MLGYGSFMFLVHSRDLLRTRYNLLSFCQNASKSTLKSINETIFPLKPKKPESAFLLYLKHIRLKLTKENFRASQSQIMKIAGKEWEALDPIEKENFQRQYHTNYEIYLKELEEYNNSITDEQKQLWKEKKKEYMKNNNVANNKQKGEIFGKPKRPLNAFFTYITSHKAEKDPNIHPTHWIQSMSRNWNALSEAEKEPYFTKAAQSMAKYNIDLDKWELKMISEGHPKVVRHKTLMKYKNVKDQQ
ncbi:unnamed protein product [Xylocopa violacea]|uniref:HMG box domain-containing protein n=1 Tax=Xylocopa violacea TaxID=135666 RepID=A0ABP1P7C9_XYLVO